MDQSGVLSGNGKFTRTSTVTRVIAGPSRRERTTPMLSCVARRSVNNHCLKHQAVAGLHGKPANLVRAAIGFDVGQWWQSCVRVWTAIDKMIRAELRPPVAAANVLHAHILSDRVKWQPNQADLIPADGPVRLVLVPRCALRGPWLLDEQLIQRCQCASNPVSQRKCFFLRLSSSFPAYPEQSVCQRFRCGGFRPGASTPRLSVL
jgi:hypothetical protein